MRLAPLKHLTTSGLIILTLVFATLFSGFANSAQLLPGDNDYVKYAGETYDYVIHKQDLHLLPELIEYNKKLNQIYQKEFGWKLDQRPTLILTSYHDQTTNGFATIFPNLITQFYSGGAAAIDRFSSKSWLYTLLTHEVNHLYQLNVKAGINSPPSWITKFLGNVLIFPALVIPIFPTPNFLTPTFMIEGAAVLNESRFGVGGRLFSGHEKAVLLAGIKEKRFPFKKLINANLEYPLSEKYLVGSFFTLWLAEKFGVERVNKFFRIQAHRYINPLFIGPTFRRQFGKSYNQLYSEFLKEYGAQAEKLKSSSAKSLAKSYSFIPLNRIGDKILFLSGENLRKQKRVGIYDIPTGKVTYQTVDVPGGKPFLIKGELQTPGVIPIDVKNKRFSMVRDGYYSNSEFEDQFVFDIHPEKGAAYAPTDTGFKPSELFVGKTKIGVTNSSALFNPQGDVYYFKQKGDTRIAYKNQQRLFQFEGHYGFPADFDSKGNFYFIAATELGTSLFKFSNGRTTRVSDLDTIADAKLIGDSKALIYEITANGFEAKVIQLNTAVRQQPSLYAYKFEGQDKDFFASIDKPSEKVIAESEVDKYYSLKNLKYSFTNIGYGYTELTGTTFSFSTLFSDPLAFSNIFVSGGFNKSEATTSFLYVNDSYRTSWYLGYLYDEDAVFSSSDDTELATLKESYPYVGWRFPLYDRGRWSAELSQEYSYRSTETLVSVSGSNVTLSESKNYQVLTSLDLARTVNLPLAFNSYRKLALTLGHQTRAEAPDWKAPTSDLIAYLQMTFGLPWQQFISLNGGSSYSESSILSLSHTKELKDSPFNLMRRFVPATTFDLERIQSAQLSYKKAIDTPLYFTVFPVSLLRVAPTLKSQYFKNVDSNSVDQEYIESAVGLEADIVFAHVAAARISLDYAFSKENVGNLERTQSAFSFNLNTEF